MWTCEHDCAWGSCSFSWERDDDRYKVDELRCGIGWTPRFLALPGIVKVVLFQQ